MCLCVYTFLITPFLGFRECKGDAACATESSDSEELWGISFKNPRIQAGRSEV